MFSLSLERRAGFLNLEMHWDIPVLRNIWDKDGHQEGPRDG